MARIRALTPLAAVPLTAVVLMAVVLTAGCSAFFEFNAFSSLDKPAAPSASRYEGSDGLANLQADLQSPAIVQALTNDPSTTQAVETYLLSHYLSGPVTTPDQQLAAILYSDLNIQTTPAGALVQNIVGTVVNGISSSSNIQSILTSVIPASALADPTQFSLMVDALIAANTQYLALGAGIQDVNLNGKIDQGEGVPPGTNMGDVAQKAGVAYTIGVISDLINAALGGGQTQATIDQQMYLLATDPSSANASVQNINPDPYTSGSSAYVTTNLPFIQKIFNCAGLSLPS